MIHEDLSLPLSAFSAYEPERLEVLPLLGQTGYSTIQSHEMLGEEMYFEFGYSNREVERSISEVLAEGLGEVGNLEMSRSICKAPSEGGNE